MLLKDAKNLKFYTDGEKLFFRKNKQFITIGYEFWEVNENTYLLPSGTIFANARLTDLQKEVEEVKEGSFYNSKVVLTENEISYTNLDYKTERVLKDGSEICDEKTMKERITKKTKEQFFKLF